MVVGSGVSEGAAVGVGSAGRSRKSEMIWLRKAVWPLREAINTLQRAESALIRPATAVYLKDVHDHTIAVIDTAKPGLTCASCHGANTGARIIDYDHAKPVTGSKCVYCHYTGQTETSASVETRSHESTSNTKDCNVSGCHRPKSYPTWNATSKTFSGGEWGEP